MEDLKKLSIRKLLALYTETAWREHYAIDNANDLLADEMRNYLTKISEALEFRTALAAARKVNK